MDMPFLRLFLHANNVLKTETLLLSQELTNLWKLIDHTEAMIKGHLDQERKNMQSIKQSPIVPLVSPSDMTDNSLPPQTVTKTQNCCYVIFDLAQAAKIYTDLTKSFPHQSLRGNNYIFLV